MQRLLKCCTRAALSSAVLELPAKCSRAPRAACGYGALVQRFTARRYSAAAGDARNRSKFTMECDRLSMLWFRLHVVLCAVRAFSLVVSENDVMADDHPASPGELARGYHFWRAAIPDPVDLSNGHPG
jgi:hypothetical protein